MEDVGGPDLVKVLVTGSDGYIGSVLAPRLIQQGHDVVGVDTGFYRGGWLFNGYAQVPATITRDVRLLTEADLAGFDAVVHLAELSNDPLGQLAPAVTEAINHRGSVALASAARAAGVRRFVYMSSCSIYGASDAAEVTEESPADPQTAYAVCKTLVERDLGALTDGDFCPTVLRNATVFGASPRMRFDLVLNNLCGLAWTTGEIAMVSDGTPWRPLVHVEDVAEAVRCVLDAPEDDVRGEAFNVGDTRHNYRVREIAEIVGAVFTGARITFGERGPDRRSYRVSFAKIAERLPAFACAWDAEKGAKELFDLFSRIGLTAADFDAPPFTRLAALQRLIDTHQVDGDLYWRTS